MRGSWLVIKRVLPVWRNASMVVRNSAVRAVSRLAVGSSAMMIAGSLIKGAGNGDPLRLSAGQKFGCSRGPVIELHLAKQIKGPVLECGMIEPQRQGRGHDIFERRHATDEIEALEDENRMSDV